MSEIAVNPHHIHVLPAIPCVIFIFSELGFVSPIVEDKYRGAPFNGSVSPGFEVSLG